MTYIYIIHPYMYLLYMCKMPVPGPTIECLQVERKIRPETPELSEG